MSIDTLLEAARYLEWQAAQQQQQITREEEQRRDKASLFTREAELRRVEVLTSQGQPIRISHVTWGEDSLRQHQQQHPSPAPLPPPPPPPPSLPPPQLPIAVIPMVPTVVTAMAASVPPLPLVTPVAAPTAPTSLGFSSPVKDGSSPPQHQPLPHHHHLMCAAQVKAEPNVLSPQPGSSPSQSQPPHIQIPYPTALITTTAAGAQHTTLLPQPTTPPQPRPNGSMSMEDLRGMDMKRRPGGAGTREVHNKLEKNRRAHLKECFETLKKNVPNVDEKKTSNLSVLRSALRYIQTLKRKEKEYEHEMERLAREKIATQQRLAELKSELSQCMDVTEIDRVLRQTVQPEDDQASTSTASEGEDIFDQDIDDDISPPPPSSLPKPPPPPPILQAQSLLPPHLSIQHPPPPPHSGVLTATVSPSGPPPPQAIAPAPPASHPLHPPPTVHVQSVISHAVSHPSVIQAVNHVLPANHKHLAHIAPSPGPPASSATPQPLTTAAAAHQPMTAQPIGHITVHPVAHLGGPLPPHLPGLYPQGVSVSQSTMVGHITHTFTHHALPHVQPGGPHAPNGGQMNGAAVPSQGSSSLGKPTAVLTAHHHHHHHPQLMGQTTVLNPVTMVTVPPFPVSTLKLA